MIEPNEELANILDSSKVQKITVPPVYMKTGSKKLMSLNTSNSMNYIVRMKVKNTYKQILEPIVEKLEKFNTDHIHMVYKIHWSDRVSRDMDNNIFIAKWLQDTMVKLGLIEDDKHVSFTFLPPVSEPELTEHYCDVTIVERTTEGTKIEE